MWLPPFLVQAAAHGARSSHGPWPSAASNMQHCMPSPQQTQPGRPTLNVVRALGVEHAGVKLARHHQVCGRACGREGGGRRVGGANSQAEGVLAGGRFRECKAAFACGRMQCRGGVAAAQRSALRCRAQAGGQRARPSAASEAHR